MNRNYLNRAICIKEIEVSIKNLPPQNNRLISFTNEFQQIFTKRSYLFYYINFFFSKKKGEVMIIGHNLNIKT